MINFLAYNPIGVIICMIFGGLLVIGVMALFDYFFKERWNMKECEDSTGLIKHQFKFSTVLMESDNQDLIYHQVGYSVCSKCGVVRKNNV